jgi:glycosyltransferase involved in cell wall biosynthesis
MSVDPRGRCSSTRTARQPVIYQLGPDTSLPGGMGTVITSYAAVLADVGDVRVVSTWAPGWRRVGRAVAAAWPLVRAPCGSIVHLHVSQGGSLLRKGLLARVARCRGLAVHATVHGSRIAEHVARRPRLVRWCLRPMSSVAALTEEVAALLPVTSPLVIPNAVHVPDQIPPAAATSFVLFAGEVGTRKGVDVLLQAWPSVVAAVPGALLLLAGPLADISRSRCEAAPGVRVLGPVPHHHVQSLLRQAAVAVLPSRAEGMPMFVLEAMAAGVPVVATALPGTRRLLGGSPLSEDLLVPVGAVEELAEALIRLLADADLRRECGVMLWERARAEFSLPRVRAALVDLYGLAEGAVR